MAEPTSEFQAIWNELHKKQELIKAVPQAENSLQDPSAFLKAVLKISDGNTQESVHPGVSKTTKSLNNSQEEKKALDTPPLVQQMFDHARQNDKAPTWYCSQLLNYYQLSGAGMPRYSYFGVGDSNLIQAHILKLSNIRKMEFISGKRSWYYDRRLFEQTFGRSYRYFRNEL